MKTIFNIENTQPQVFSYKNTQPQTDEKNFKHVKDIQQSHIIEWIRHLTETNQKDFKKEIKIKLNNKEILLNKEDIKKGKILCVGQEEINKQERYINLRNDMHQIPLTYIEKYNIGLGSSSNRTPEQKEAARKYVKQITDKEAKENIILCTDGSIISAKNEESGYGGIIQKAKDIQDKDYNKWIVKFYNRQRKENDITQLELKAIEEGLKIVKQNAKHLKTRNVLVLSDSLKGIKEIKYKHINNSNETVKEIKKLTEELKKQHKIKTRFNWIPSHIDFTPNEQADKLAKKGATKTNQELTVLHNGRRNAQFIKDKDRMKYNEDKKDFCNKFYSNNITNYILSFMPSKV
jgi:ribonuclease HI